MGEDVMDRGGGNRDCDDRACGRGGARGREERLGLVGDTYAWLAEARRDVGGFNHVVRHRTEDCFEVCVIRWRRCVERRWSNETTHGFLLKKVKLEEGVRRVSRERLELSAPDLSSPLLRPSRLPIPPTALVCSPLVKTLLERAILCSVSDSFLRPPVGSVWRVVRGRRLTMYRCGFGR